MQVIRARIRDISGARPSAPRLKVAFRPSDADALPAEHRGGLEIQIEGDAHRATIGLKPGPPRTRTRGWSPPQDACAGPSRSCGMGRVTPLALVHHLPARGAMS